MPPTTPDSSRKFIRLHKIQDINSTHNPSEDIKVHTASINKSSGTNP